MRSLRIFVKNIELEHVREDVKVREENACFYNALKIPHTTRPVRIVENEAAINALGEQRVASAGKKKYFECRVMLGSISYSGILIQNQKINGFRKCDIKYGSALNAVMDKKIASFFPAFNVTGSATPPPYDKDSDARFDVQQEWADEAQLRSGKAFPQVKWQLPQIEYQDKFGTDLKEGDAHRFYRGFLNHRDLEGLSQNDLISNDTYFSVHNTNVLAPQVFVLSPLFYAFQSLGYVLRGNVVSSGLFKRLLLASFNDNMTRVKVKPVPAALDITTPGWVQKGIPGVLDGIPYQTYVKEVDFTINDPGEYKLGYDLTMTFPPSSNLVFWGLQLYQGGSLKAKFNASYPGEYRGEFNFTVEEGEQPKTYTLLFHSFKRILPSEYSMGPYENLEELDYYDMHPTVDFSRYIPDWSVAEYLNNFMNLFNWKIDFDEVEKTVFINFAEKDYLIDGEILPIRKSLEIRDPENIEAESYLLKYDNDEDTFQYISKEPAQFNMSGDEYTKELPTKFKYIPYNGYTSRFTEAVEDKSGEGLMIYDPINAPFTSRDFSGQDLSIPGPGGIYETFWKKWMLFKLNASRAVLRGPFTHTELFQISKTKKLYIDHQLWMVKAVEYKENNAALFETEIEVESVTF